MDTHRILSFLNGIARNNNREWFLKNKTEYLAVRADFEADVTKAIMRIASFDDSIAHITAKDATYRFNRDTRFSPDKSPYKRHFGAYIAAHGKKAMHGGYYIHIEPGNSMLSCGSYWLPTNVLTACRNEIMVNIDEWRSIVENDEFVRLFGRAGEHTWTETGSNGFGSEHLKSCPAGFPRDYEHIQYLRMKDYCVWHAVTDDFYSSDGWLDYMEHVFRVGRPMMDFINAVIDDYE